MRHLALLAVLGGSISAMGSPAAAQNTIAIPAGANVYIDRLEPAFESDIRAELKRQRVPLQIVSSEDLVEELKKQIQRLP